MAALRPPRLDAAATEVAAQPPFAAHVGAATADRNFATPEETERRLHGAGFTDVWCWTTRVDVDPGDADGYLRAICCGSLLARLPPEHHDAFVAAVLDRLGEPVVLRYVRLNMLARAAT